MTMSCPTDPKKNNESKIQDNTDLCLDSCLHCEQNRFIIAPFRIILKLLNVRQMYPLILSLNWGQRTMINLNFMKVSSIDTVFFRKDVAESNC